MSSSEQLQRERKKKRDVGRVRSGNIFAEMIVISEDGKDVMDAMSVYSNHTVDWQVYKPKLLRFLQNAQLNTWPDWTELSFKQKQDLYKWFQWTHLDFDKYAIEDYPNPSPTVTQSNALAQANSREPDNNAQWNANEMGISRTFQSSPQPQFAAYLQSIIQSSKNPNSNANPSENLNPQSRMRTGAFWHYPSEDQMNSSWRKRESSHSTPNTRSLPHQRHPGKRMSMYAFKKKATGAEMQQQNCQGAYENEHDTTVKELAQDLKDKLPLGLSLALRAATGNADLVKAASKIHTRHGKVDYAGVLKNILPASTVSAMEHAKTGDLMKPSESSSGTATAEKWDKELVKSLDVLQKQVPVWQKARITALREFVHKNFDREQAKTQTDVNITASQLIARLGILRATEKANLKTKYADLIAVHLK